MDTKNPSVPVRRGVISKPSGDCRTAPANSLALSPNTVTVSAGGTSVNSGWRATKARIWSPFSGGNTEHDDDQAARQAPDACKQEQQRQRCRADCNANQIPVRDLTE